MALAIDVSTPAITSAAAATCTTAAFTTPAAVLLVALVGRDTGVAAANSLGTVSGAGLTWTLAGRKTDSTGATGVITGGTAQPGCVDVWWAYSAAALTSATITDTRADNGTKNHALKVMVLTGAETTWAGAVAANGAASGLPTVTLTTTAGNAWVFAASLDWAQKGLGTADTGQTIVDEFNSTSNITFHVWRQTSTTAASGTSVTNDLTAPAAEQYNIVGIELRAVAGGGGAAVSPRRMTVVRQAPMRAANF